MIVIEKQERVNTNVLLAFNMLDIAMKDMTRENLVVVFNKADPDEDSFESVRDYYAEAYQQSECKNLPEP